MTWTFATYPRNPNSGRGQLLEGSRVVAYDVGREDAEKIINAMQETDMGKQLSDRDMLRGMLGGWIAHGEPRLVTDPIHGADGSIEFVVRIKVNAEQAAKARAEYQARVGGWAGVP